MSKAKSILRQRSLLLAIILSAIGTVTFAAEEEPNQGTTEVKIRDLVLTIPASWKKEDARSRLRLGQFRIPAIGGEKTDAELAIFSFGASDLSANIKRWISQYEAEGRKTKIMQGESKQGAYVIVELSGTYKKSVGPPIAGKTESVPGSRSLAVILLIPEKGVYYLKLVGLDKTVAAQAKAFRAAFGADGTKEKEIKIEKTRDVIAFCAFCKRTFSRPLGSFGQWMLHLQLSLQTTGRRP